MPIRVECSTPGLEENWIEVAEVWTQDELREFLTLRGEPFVAIFARKVTACHLVTPDGTVITDPAAVLENRGKFDLRLVRFPTTAVLEATDHLLTLGEANKRLSSAGAGVAARTTPAPVKASPTAAA